MKLRHVLITLGIVLAASAHVGAQESHYVKVEMKGKLSNKPLPKIAGFMVIDESHDAVLIVGKDSWRLSLPDDKAIRDAVRKLNNKTVIVTGTVQFRDALGRTQPPSASGSNNPKEPSSPLPPLYVVRVATVKSADLK